MISSPHPLALTVLFFAVKQWFGETVPAYQRVSFAMIAGIGSAWGRVLTGGAALVVCGHGFSPRSGERESNQQ